MLLDQGQLNRSKKIFSSWHLHCISVAIKQDGVLLLVCLRAVRICSMFTLNRCGIAPELEALAMDRADWCSSCKSAVEKFEIRRIQNLESKRDLCKSGPPPTSNFECQICHRMCRSRIGLLDHNKSHSWWRDLSCQWLSPWSLWVVCMRLKGNLVTYLI